MGRLPWLAAMGAGPLAAMLLVAHQRAPLVRALAEVRRGSFDRAATQGALERARGAANCQSCGLGDQGEVDLAYGRWYEANDNLQGALQSYASARDELGTGRGWRDAQEAGTGWTRVHGEISRRAQEEHLANLERLAKEEQASKEKEPPPSPPPAVLVGRAEVAIGEDDAEAAAAALDGVDDEELGDDPALQVRAIRAEAQVEALQGDPTKEDDFQRAVKLELDNLGAAWSDPATTLRLWARAEGKLPTPVLVQALRDAIEACAKAMDQHADLRVARVQLILGEALVAQGDDAAATPMLTNALNRLAWSRTPDSVQATRDLIELGDLEAEQGNYQAAYNHYLLGAGHLDREVTPVRERSEAWRKAGALVARLVRHKARWKEADLDYQRALGAVINDLEPNDPEVVDDRLALAESKLSLGDKEAARAQLAEVTAAAPIGDERGRLIVLMRRMGARSPIEASSFLNAAPKKSP